MSAPWFRVASNFHTDAKLRRARARSIWPWILCRLKDGEVNGIGFVSDGTLDPWALADDHDNDFSEAEAARKIEALKSVGLLVRHGDGWTTPKWEQYQRPDRTTKPDPTANERQQRRREKQRDAERDNRDGAVTERDNRDGRDNGVTERDLARDRARDRTGQLQPQDRTDLIPPLPPPSGSDRAEGTPGGYAPSGAEARTQDTRPTSAPAPSPGAKPCAGCGGEVPAAWTGKPCPSCGLSWGDASPSPPASPPQRVNGKSRPEHHELPPPPPESEMVNGVEHYTAFGFERRASVRFADGLWHQPKRQSLATRMARDYPRWEIDRAFADPGAKDLDSPWGLEGLIKRLAREASVPPRSSVPPGYSVAPKEATREYHQREARKRFRQENAKDPDTILELVAEMDAAGERAPAFIRKMWKDVFAAAGREIPNRALD